MTKTLPTMKTSLIFLLFWGLFGIIVAIWLASSQPRSDSAVQQQIESPELIDTIDQEEGFDDAPSLPTGDDSVLSNGLVIESKESDHNGLPEQDENTEETGQPEQHED